MTELFEARVLAYLDEIKRQHASRTSFHEEVLGVLSELQNQQERHGELFDQISERLEHITRALDSRNSPKPCKVVINKYGSSFLSVEELPDGIVVELRDYSISKNYLQDDVQVDQKGQRYLPVILG